MLKIISRATFFIFGSIALILILFTGWTSADALVKGWSPIEKESLSPEANGDNPLRIVIEPSGENQNIDEEDKNQSNYPDLGSEQVFPFEPGLGNGA